MNNFIKLALIGLLAMATSHCIAQEHTIGLHLWSHHSKDGTAFTRDRSRFNNRNFGLYYEHQSGFTAGIYRNSFNRTSSYLGWTYTVYSALGIDLDVSAVALSGYKGFNSNHRWRIGVLPSLALPKMGALRPRVLVAPAAHEKSATVINLMIETSF